MNIVRLFLILFTFLLIGCSDKDENSIDELEAIGILGSWEINSRSFDGIEPLIVLCCEFIEFSVDGNKEDFSGIYNLSSGQFNETGTFTLESSNRTLLMQDDNNMNQYQFILSETLQEFELIYNEQDDDIQIVETWIKVD